MIIIIQSNLLKEATQTVKIILVELLMAGGHLPELNYNGSLICEEVPTHLCFGREFVAAEISLLRVGNTITANKETTLCTKWLLTRR